MGPRTDRVVDVTVLAMWAHPRSVSTAFLRMMIERGDVTVVHEPLVTLTDFGEVTLPDTGDGTVVVRSPGDVFAQFGKLAAERAVFFKDTLEYRYAYLFDHPEAVAGLTHTFIVREPAATIASHAAVKPEVTCQEIGYEHQWDLFRLVREATGRRPVVVSAERLLADPAGVVSAWCGEVGLSYLPEALQWRPEDRAEFRLTRKWHLDTIASSGFRAPQKDYARTVDNDERLRSYLEHHRPFYERLIEHVL